MDDLVTWLRAIWDEEEQMAKAVNYGDCYFDCYEPHELHSRFDADRVLTEVTAKRRIVEVAVSRWKAADLLPDGHAQAAAGALAIVQLLALPHAGWPGYRDEWRP